MYKIEITAETLAELTGKVTTLAAKLNTGAATERPVEQAQPVEAEKPKAAKKAAKKAEPEVAEEAPADPTPEEPTPTSKAAETTEQPSSQPTEATPPASASEPTLDFEKDVAPVVIEAVARVGREGVSSTLAEFGAERASEVDPAQYAELVKALEAL